MLKYILFSSKQYRPTNLRLVQSLLGLMCIALFSVSLSSCKPAPAPKKKIGKPYNPYLIRFVTIKGHSTYFVNSQNQYAGLEYDLAKRFQTFLGPKYQVEFIIANRFANVLPMLLRGEADIAGANIDITENRRRLYTFGPSFYEVQPLLSYHQNNLNPPKSLAELKDKPISLPKGASSTEHLNTIKKVMPELNWHETSHANTEQLLEALAQEDIEYAVADHHLLALMQYYYPQIKSGFKVGEAKQIAWAINKRTSKQRLMQIQTFFKTIEQDGTLRNLIDRYHGNTKRLRQGDVNAFLQRAHTLLPQYTRLFKNAQEVTEIDWRLLAALSYQESHWDTFNTSPTNVRGLMMLTEQTADAMKVTDRLDPKQSIMAGAKYLLWLKDRLPARIQDPDRIYMALAAYNVGLGHLEDARVLAQRLALNPDSWADVKKALVLLNNPEHYHNAKYGYCSCGAPVIYTESIRSYYQIMEKHFPAYAPNIDPYKIALVDQTHQLGALR